MPKRIFAAIECVVCHETKPRAARGMCRACYSRWQKTGTTEYRRQPHTCVVEGCERKSHAMGLCSMHWQRLRRAGSTGVAASLKQVATGHTSHEMYQTWDNARRRDLADEWKDFDAFVSGIGERPSRKHRLVRRNLREPLGPLNFEWRAPVASKEPGETVTEYNRRYKAALRAQTGRAYRESDLISRYGLTLPKMAALVAEQDNRCAICGQYETDRDASGNVKALAVDHDHATNRVRGLLCQHCNTGLGKFKDDPRLLAVAIAYLARHAAD